MVKYLLTLLLICFFSSNALAQMEFDASFGDSDEYNPIAEKEKLPPSFNAQIDKKKIAVGQPFKIKLELQNADAYSAPDMSLLPSELKVQSQSQMSNVSMVNGISSKTNSWIYEVIAEHPGAYSVPPISIQTDIGTLHSQSFNLYAKDASELPSNTNDGTIFIEAKIEKKNPFKGEPIEYITKVYNLNPINNAELEKPKSEDAKIEQLTEPEKSQEFLNGKQYNVLEVRYLVTPLASGKVKIEPSILRGQILKEVKRKRPRTAFDDFFDPFAVIDSAFSVTREMEPFTVASNRITLDVKPEIEGVEPWLALYDLKIDDELLDLTTTADKELKAKVGEPISRKIVLTAIGITGEDLPDINNFINAPNFKIYSDKPQIDKKILTKVKGSIASKIKGIKSQSFTFIPEKKGQLALPELKIAYYSIPEGKVKYAVLPAKTLNVEPSDNNSVNKFTERNNSGAETEDIASDEEGGVQSSFGFSLNTILLIILILLVLYFLIKISKLKTGNISKEVIVANSSTSLARKIDDGGASGKATKITSIVQEIESAENFKMLEKAIKAFAVQDIGVSENSSVTIIAQQIARKYKLSKSEMVKCCADLDAAIYANKDVNLDSLKSNLSKMFAQIEDKIDSKSSKGKSKRLNPLNPK